MSAASPVSHSQCPDSPIVSIVVPTFNRKDRLIRCLDKIRRNVSVPHETIVIDGGSTDGTRQWLREQPHIDPSPDGTGSSDSTSLIVIFERLREGAVRAFNKGFKAATGRYVMWLNDDAYPLPGSVEAAIEMIERPQLPDLGMVAFYHNWHSERNVLDCVERDGASYELCHVRGHPYANFGLLRRELLEKIGYADERFYFFGFDPDLSLRIQLGEKLRVLGCRQALIHHDEHHDERKLDDLARGRKDNEKLFAKWRLPAAGQYPDPVPGYRRMMEQYGLLPRELPC